MGQDIRRRYIDDLNSAMRAQQFQVYEIRRDVDRRNKNEKAGQSDWIRISPTCPPSTDVEVRGGYLYVWVGDGSSQGAAIDPTTAEFGAGGNCEVTAFGTANYYRGIILCIDIDGDLSTVETAEVADSALAQAAAEALLETGSPYTDVLPVALIVVRNDGTTGVAGAILPVDAANRQRSYMFREVRPWLHYHQYPFH